MNKEQLFEKMDFKEGDKIYYIRHRANAETNSIKVQRLNYGFNAYELLGILEHSQLDIHKQISGVISPNIEKIERIVLQNEENK